jgi:hypothetical protein
VIVQARGNDLDGGANNDFVFTTVTGTAAASPTVPAVPNNAVALAQIYVPGGSASVTAGNITDVRPGTVPLPKLPAGRLALVQKTVDVVSASAAEFVTATTPAVYIPPNRLITVQAYFRNAVTNDPFCQLRLREGATLAGTQIADFVINMTVSGAQVGSGTGGTLTYTYPSPPSSGVRQWTLTQAGLSGANTTRVTAVTNTPIWVAVFDDGGI